MAVFLLEVNISVDLKYVIRSKGVWHLAGAYENKNMKISSGGLMAIYTKICTYQNFLLYGIRLSWDRWDLSNAHKPCQGQTGMSKVILGQMGLLVPLNHNAHKPCQGQPGMSKLVLGQIGHLVPGKAITRN